MSGEANHGATKLEWSDDEDDFFSEDEEEIGTAEKELLEEVAPNEIAEVEYTDLPAAVDDAIMEANANDDCNDEQDDAMDQPEDEPSPSRTTISHPDPGLPPLSKRTQNAKNSDLSIAEESESTAVVEPEDQDFEEIVRKRNRVSQKRKRIKLRTLVVNCKKQNT